LFSIFQCRLYEALSPGCAKLKINKCKQNISLILFPEQVVSGKRKGSAGPPVLSGAKIAVREINVIFAATNPF
jgi:hypothetical protein